MRWMRVSSSASTPRSVFVRISRPNPCFSDSTACGTWNSAKALRPSSCSACTRAATMGSLGTANGSRSTITQDICSPGTSTPCQKLAVANSTAASVFLNRSSSADRGAVPCSSKGKETRERTRSNNSFIDVSQILRRQRTLLRVIDAQALADVVESSAHRKCRRRQNYGVELLEKPLPQNLAHVDGRGRKENTFVPPLVPIHEILFIGFEQEGQFLPQLEAAPRDPSQLFRFGCLRGGFGFQSFQRGDQRVVRLAVLFQECRAFVPRKREPPFARRKQFEETAVALANPLCFPQQRRCAQTQQPQRLVGVPRQFLEPEV